MSDSLEKRVEAIRAVRKLLAEGAEQPLIHPWAFFAWPALLAIWPPVLLLGGSAEGISFARKVNAIKAPPFNRHLGGPLPGATASMIILSVVGVHLSLAQTLPPGLAVTLGPFAIVFYAQICFAALFVEAFVDIAAGIVPELVGAAGPEAFLAVVDLLYRDEYAAFTSLRDRIEASGGAAYSHLERLIGSGYLEKRKEIAGTKAQTVYRFTPTGRCEFEAYVRVVEELLASQTNRGNR